MIDSKVTKESRDRDIGLVYVGHFSHRRSGHEVVLEFHHGVAITFGQDFDASVVQVANSAHDLMTSGGPQDEEAIAYALNIA